MSTSDVGRANIKREEGGQLHAYQDVVGVWTVGYGHTGPDVLPHAIWTQQQVDAAFDADIARFEHAIDSALHKPVLQAEFDALVSLAYNEGAAAIANSTIVRLINAEAPIAVVAQHFLDWIYVTVAGEKRLSNAHVKRRGREMLRFLGYAV